MLLKELPLGQECMSARWDYSVEVAAVNRLADRQARVIALLGERNDS